jgi:hypothetical protein
MPSLKIENTESTMLEPGIHLARIEDAVEAVSSAGNEMLKLKVKVGTLTFSAWVVFTAKNARNVADFGIAIGKKVVEGKTLTIEAEDCVDKIAKVELGHGDRINEKTGRPYLEIKRWMPISAGSDEEMGDEIPF